MPTTATKPLTLEQLLAEKKALTEQIKATRAAAKAGRATNAHLPKNAVNALKARVERLVNNGESRESAVDAVLAELKTVLLLSDAEPAQV